MEENFHFICILNHVSAGDDVSVISLLTDDKARSQGMGFPRSHHPPAAFRIEEMADGS